MRKFKWWLRAQGQKFFPKVTLAVLANRTWVLEPEVALVGLLSRKKGVAIDAGVNKGVYLYHLSRHFRSVIGFEPLPVLSRYLAKAAPANAIVHSLALSDAAGTATLRLPRGYNELGSLEAHTAETWTTSEPVEEHSVELRSLDSFKLADVALLKIDVEGHEMAVLKGATETLQRCKPTILVEVEERHGSGGVARIQTFLENLGFSGYFLDGLMLRPIRDFDRERDQNIASLSHSVKVARYINNFIYFDRREALERVAVITQALQGTSALELGAALQPGHTGTARERLGGSVRVARDMLVPLDRAA